MAKLFTKIQIEREARALRYFTALKPTRGPSRRGNWWVHLFREFSSIAVKNSSDGGTHKWGLVLLFRGSILHGVC